MPKKAKTPKPTQQPKDRFFRAYLGRVRQARQLLRWQLPEILKRALNWRTMRVKSTTFVDERLRKQESDLLIEFRSKGGEPVLVYVLWEHQSIVDPMMAWRVLCYRVEVWKAWRLENPKARRLPFIYTMVLHQGRQTWNALRDLGELIAFDELGLDGPPNEQKVNSQYGVIPVIDLPKLGWPKDLALRLGLGVMRAVALGTQTDWLVEEGAQLNELLNQPGGDVNFRIVVEYVFKTEGDEKRVIEALEKTPSEIEIIAMSVYDQLIERGERRGEKRGEERGMEKSRHEMISIMLRKGLTAQEIADLIEVPIEDVKKAEAEL